jgi:hypothetical protein
LCEERKYEKLDYLCREKRKLYRKNSIVRDLYTYMGWSLGPSRGLTHLKKLQATNTAEEATGPW